jgi:hypothetical protein
LFGYFLGIEEIKFVESIVTGSGYFSIGVLGNQSSVWRCTNLADVDQRDGILDSDVIKKC